MPPSSRRSPRRDMSPESSLPRGIRYQVPDELPTSGDEPDWDDAATDYTQGAGDANYGHHSAHGRRQLERAGFRLVCSPTPADAFTAKNDSSYEYRQFHCPDEGVATPRRTSDAKTRRRWHSQSTRPENIKERLSLFPSFPKSLVCSKQQGMTETGGPSLLDLSRQDVAHKFSIAKEGESREKSHAGNTKKGWVLPSCKKIRHRSVVDDRTNYPGQSVAPEPDAATPAPHSDEQPRNRSSLPSQKIKRLPLSFQTAGCVQSSLGALLAPRLLASLGKAKAPPKSATEIDNEELTKEQARRELKQLRKELANLKRWNADETVDAEPSNGQRAVRFSHPIVTSLKYRPRTKPEERSDLYFDEKELMTFEKERRSRLADEQVECIASNIQEELRVSVTFPKMQAGSRQPSREIHRGADLPS